jgi:hypothetical protein
MVGAIIMAYDIHVDGKGTTCTWTCTWKCTETVLRTLLVFIAYVESAQIKARCLLRNTAKANDNLLINRHAAYTTLRPL